MSASEKLTRIAENTERVYQAGKQKGHKSFWDIFQENGAAKSYAYAFSRWNPDAFYPCHDIIATDSLTQTFSFRGATFDMAERLRECGVILDTSGCTGFSWSFFECASNHLPAIDTRNASNLDNTFYNATKVVTIDKIILKSDGSQTFSTPFSYLDSLENITFEGCIGQNGFKISNSTRLTHDSLMSIIGALKDYSENTDGTTYTVTLGTANLAKLTDAEKEIATSKGWILK